MPSNTRIVGIRSAERPPAHLVGVAARQQPAAEMASARACVVVALEEAALRRGDPGEGGADEVTVRVLGGCEEEEKPPLPAA